MLLKLTTRLLPIILLALGAHAAASAQSIDLGAPGNRPINTKVESVDYKGKKAVRVTISEATAARMAAAGERTGRTKQDKVERPVRKAGGAEAGRVECLVLIDGVEFHNGVIELDLAGEPGSGAAGGARGFVGLAWRVQPDLHTYDAFYVRPTNGRADDQERRNHSVQYIQHPDWPWFRLRSETPSKYETYADMTPGEWIHLKIEVEGEKARLWVNDAEQPTLLVNDVKSGADGKGRIALWIEGSTIAHFANLNVTAK